MIIVLKPNTQKQDLQHVEEMVKARGLETHIVHGQDVTIIGCIGDTSHIDPKFFEVNPSVDKVIHVQQPYKLANTVVIHHAYGQSKHQAHETEPALFVHKRGG